MGSTGEFCMKGLELHGNRNIKWESSNTKTEGEGTQIRVWDIHKAQIGKPEPKAPKVHQLPH